MALSTDDSQTTGSLHLVGELDVGTTTGHIGGDGDGALQTCLGYDVGLLLVEFSVQYVVLYLAHGEHTAQQLTDFYGCGTHKYGASLGHHLLHLGDDSVVLLALGLVDAVVHVVTCDGAVGGDYHHIELVDIPQLASLGLGRTGHTRQLVIHAEVVLQSDGSEGLCRSLHLHTLLGLDGLVQAVAIATPLHDTSCLLIHDFHLALFGHDILGILLKHGIGLEQLVDGMYALALYGVVGEEFVLLCQ